VFDRKTIQDFGTESWLQDVCRAVEQQLTDRKADSDERVWRTELKDADEDSEDIAKMFANVIRVAVKGWCTCDCGTVHLCLLIVLAFDQC
jgi:hypothetical protein